MSNDYHDCWDGEEDDWWDEEYCDYAEWLEEGRDLATSPFLLQVEDRTMDRIELMCPSHRGVPTYLAEDGRVWPLPVDDSVGGA